MNRIQMTKAVEMNEFQKEKGKQWFINRFVEDVGMKQEFARINVGLQPKTVDQKKKWRQYQFRNKRYNFQFLDTRFRLVIQPDSEEAAWATGVIWLDIRGEYHFMSMDKIGLLTTLEIEDEPTP